MRRNRLPALIFLLVGVIALPASAITPHEYLEQGQWSEAVSAYNKVLKEIPDDPIALNNRGFAKHRLGKYKSAISDYDKALKLKPGWYIALNNRGRAYRHLKEFKKAQADFESAIRAMPKSVHGWNNRGRTWADMGKYQRGIFDLTMAIQVDPDYSYPYYNRGICHRALKHHDKADKDFDKALSLGYPKERLVSDSNSK